MSDVAEWRPIPGFNGRYEASSDGKVRTCIKSSRIGYHGVLTGSMYRGYRYLRVRPYEGAKKIAHGEHHLVATAFYGPPLPGQECRHLDGNPANNRPENLRWGTRLENMQDMERHGTRPRGERHGGAKLTEDDVRAIRAAVNVHGTVLAVQYGVGTTTISKTRNRRARAWDWFEKEPPKP